MKLKCHESLPNVDFNFNLHRYTTGMLAAPAMTSTSDGESERWHQRALKPLRGLGKLLAPEVRAAM